MNGILVLCQGDTVLLWHPHKSIQSEHVKIDIIVVSASNERRPKFLKLISDIQHHVCVTLFFKYDVHNYTHPKTSYDVCQPMRPSVVVGLAPHHAFWNVTHTLRMALYCNTVINKLVYWEAYYGDFRGHCHDNRETWKCTYIMLKLRSICMFYLCGDW